MSGIGSLYEWMELASDCRDKATKLYNWISNPRAIEIALQTMIGGINAARTDIINGGQFWWLANPMGVSNIFSAISITPRGCRYMPDLFRGLLGIFSGLFTAEEIRTQISGNDIEKISFAFFKRLSTKTGNAWTKLSISARERGEWDWIPVVEHDPNTIRDEDDEDDDDDDDDDDDETEMKPGEPKQRTRKNRIKTDIFAGVANLGYLREKGRAKTQGLTGLHGVPRKFMSIRLKEENPQFHFIFRGCNCGKKVNAGFFKSEAILTYNAAVDVTGDETGRTLAQCATILGCLLDPAGNVLEYKSRLLRKLNPQWEMTDPGARPSRWPERCVSGTIWADASCPFLLRTHNMSMNYRFGAITECESRLAQGTTANISCEVRINCGCTIVAPFSLVFEALMAVEGSSLGGTDGKGDKDGRIVVKDGLGLVQIGDLGKTFNLVAFGGDLDFHRSNAALCRKTKKGRAIVPTKACPMGRALIRSDFTHDMTDVLRNYGYVQTGVGNLLICRDHPLGNYKIRGVCIDNYIATKNGQQIHGVRIE
ncbi:hypothetical protein F4802DRAFT_575799 [Xylaria palmicola]|nr:hypothetical protein F4802DRAFT_575799 [Xylaria palmicola]